MPDDALGDLIATLGSIDHDEVDWASVVRVSYAIHHHLRYEYPGPIENLHQRLIVIPPDSHGDQRLITHKLRVSGCNVGVERSYDTFGNVVLDVSLDRVERDVDFTAWVLVERESALAGNGGPEPLAPDDRLEAYSRFTTPDKALRAVAAELEGLEGLALAEQISQRVHAHLVYGHDATTVETGAGEAWAGGVGVCQDYAHCMLALCRLRGLPARYVSGHLLGEGGTHAWVEALVAHPDEPDALQAVVFDPVHHPRAEPLRYITVAVGRDYHDVAPTSGTFEAPYGGELSTYKRAAVTRVEYERRRRRRPGQRSSR
jgi:transglutaminase-like putative cysteine protease